MLVHERDLQITKGEVSVVERDLGLRGSKRLKHYCGSCSAPIWYSIDSAPNIAVLKPGTLDDASWAKPVAHVWMSSALPWVAFNDDAPQYDDEGPGFETLIELWQKRKA
jgi:hypothetical protein